MLLRAATLVVALGIAALAASTASAAVVGTVTCVDSTHVLLSVTGLTAGGTATIQPILGGTPADPATVTTTAEGTFSQVYTVGTQSMVFHIVDDTTGLSTTTTAITCTLAPQAKEECMGGGYETFGYTNQGQCVSFVASKGRRTG